MGLDVNGDVVIPGGGHATNVLRLNGRPIRREKVHLVGEANAGQGAPWTLGTVHQGFGDSPGGGHGANAGQQVQRAGYEGVVEGDRHRLAGFHEVEHSLGAGVAVGAEQQSLDADLDPLRLPGPLRHVGGLAVLVVHGGDHVAPAFDQVNTGDGSQGIVGEQHGPGVYGLRGFAVLLRHVRSDAAGPRGQLARRLVHPAVLETSLDGINTVGEFTLHPFQVGQAEAVGVLVEHAGGDQFRKRVV